MAIFIIDCEEMTLFYLVAGCKSNHVVTCFMLVIFSTFIVYVWNTLRKLEKTDLE